MVRDYSATNTYTTIAPAEPTSVTYYVRVKDTDGATSDSCQSVTVTWQNVAPTAKAVSGSAKE